MEGKNPLEFEKLEGVRGLFMLRFTCMTFYAQGMGYGVWVN